MSFMSCRSAACTMGSRSHKITVISFCLCLFFSLFTAQRFFNLSSMSCASLSSCSDFLSALLVRRGLDGSSPCRFISTELGDDDKFCASKIFCTGMLVRVRERIRSTGRPKKEQHKTKGLKMHWSPPL